jgi:hypothetical protein
MCGGALHRCGVRYVFRACSDDADSGEFGAFGSVHVRDGDRTYWRFAFVHPYSFHVALRQASCDSVRESVGANEDGEGATRILG